MKVLFSPCHYLYDDLSSGSEIAWAFNIADGVARKYPDSVVITGRKKTRTEFPYEIKELQPEKEELDLSLGNAWRFNRQYFEATRAYMKRGGYNVLHHVLPFGLDSTYNKYFLKYGPGKHIPFVLGPLQSPLGYVHRDIDAKNVHGNDQTKRSIIPRLISGLARPWLRKQSEKTLQAADQVIAINEHTKDLLQKRGVKASKVKIIPPGIKLSSFPYAPPTTADKTWRIVSVGYLIERKGFDLLLRALAEIVKEDKQVMLKIIGNGPQEKNLKKQAKELKLIQNVEFLGYVPNDKLGAIYRESDVLASMSWAESWGQAYIEAMASGLPIISTKNVGALSIVEEGHTGHLVPPGDYRTLARRLLALRRDPDKKRRMSQAACQIVEQKYDWAKIIPQYIKVYKSLIQKNG